MPIPTELVDSLPRPSNLQAAIAQYDAAKITLEDLTREQDAAAFDSIVRSEATGEPIVSDGEQRASTFAANPLTDSLAGTVLCEKLAADGQYFAILDDGHHCQLPRRDAHAALSFDGGVPYYSREQFQNDPRNPGRAAICSKRSSLSIIGSSFILR